MVLIETVPCPCISLPIHNHILVLFHFLSTEHDGEKGILKPFLADKCLLIMCYLLIQKKKVI